MGWVLFFDGDCAFCSDSVRRVARFDTRRSIDFAPLQGKFAAEKGFSNYADKKGGTMVLLRESDGRVFLRSDALIELARALGGAWRALAIAGFFPKFLRDAAYNWIADHRYLFPGTKNSCMLPDPALMERLRD